MSAIGNAFTNPSSGKIDQQRKILEELERRKKQLNQQSPTNLVNQMNNSNHVVLATNPAQPLPSNSNLIPAVGGQQPAGLNPDGSQLLNNNQRAALEVANKSSFGYFIPQDSNFGNHILPVIPRQ